MWARAKAGGCYADHNLLWKGIGDIWAGEWHDLLYALKDHSGSCVPSRMASCRARQEWGREVWGGATGIIQVEDDGDLKYMLAMELMRRSQSLVHVKGGGYSQLLLGQMWATKGRDGLLISSFTNIQGPAQIMPLFYYKLFYYNIISISFCNITISHSSLPYDTLGEMFKLKL